MDKKILITSALPYVNNVPHLGNIIGCVLPGDTYYRYMKMMGRDVIYICGADEYGTCTEVKAREEGVTSKEICDKYIEIHKNIYSWFQIDFSYFGRTSTDCPKDNLEWNHTMISQDIFIKLAENDCLVEDEMEQLYCKEISSFVSDRFVQGQCPKCNYDKAKGDQCDGCGQLLNTTKIIDPVYKLNNNYHLEIRKTNHLKLNLPKLEPKLRQWIDRVKSSWDKNTIGITQGWLDKGLEPRCITRDLKWGTPVPHTTKYGDKYKDKVMYNWFDAPIGYISITSEFTKGLDIEWKEWWKNPDKVDLVQFYGIDNVPFHTIIFPASLIGADDNYTLVNKISAVNYLTYRGGKFSKSEGIGIFGDDAMNTSIPSDIWRYYLLLQRPENKTTEFSWKDLQAKVNGELNDNIGNLAHRILTFTFKHFNKSVPKIVGNITNDDDVFIKNINELVKIYFDHMKEIKLKDGLITILKIGHQTNKYMVVTEPWAIIKNDRARCGNIMHILCHTLGLIARLISPFMPSSSLKLNNMLGYDYTTNDLKINIFSDTIMTKPVILFDKISNEEIDEYEKRFG